MHIFALVCLRVTLFSIFPRWCVTWHLHTFPQAKVFEIVFMDQIRGDSCLHDSKQQFSYSVPILNQFTVSVINRGIPFLFYKGIKCHELSKMISVEFLARGSERSWEQEIWLFLKTKQETERRKGNRTVVVGKYHRHDLPKVVLFVFCFWGFLCNFFIEVSWPQMLQ